jgi:hypothetical protein
MSDHTISLRYSNDGAHNWSDWRLKEAGPIGAFEMPLIWRRLGMARHRVWEFEDTSAYSSDVLAAMVMVESE